MTINTISFIEKSAIFRQLLIKLIKFLSINAQLCFKEHRSWTNIDQCQMRNFEGHFLHMANQNEANFIVKKKKKKKKQQQLLIRK